jgi:hypothetical protein
MGGTEMGHSPNNTYVCFRMAFRGTPGLAGLGFASLRLVKPRPILESAR